MRLSSFRGRQFLHYDIGGDGDVGLTSRRDENELSPDRSPGSSHLIIISKNDHGEQKKGEKNTHKHVNGHFPVDMVHIHITTEVSNIPSSEQSNLQFIEATDRGAHGFP